MIPLAAFLLEYPVGYVVESPGLVDILLIIIEISLIYLSSPGAR
jgi:hypothetical protein